jgi:predicted nucleic acid-binding protein
MTAQLFDTNMLSCYLEPRARARNPTAAQLVEDSLNADGLYISSVTKYEMRRGVRKLRLAGEGIRKEAAVERLLDAAYLVSPDGGGGTTWDVAAALWAVASTNGIPIGDADLIIASTAMANGMEFVTTDARLVEKLEQVGFTGGIKMVDVPTAPTSV